MTIASEPTTLSVDVVSDVICPWCYVGKRRLETALRSLPTTLRVQTRWRPFELNPQTPEEGVDRQEYLARKFGLIRVQQMHERLTDVARAEGLDFHLERQSRVPNTRTAHRLVWLAAQGGLQDAMVEALFRAYFVDGRDVGHRTVLEELAIGAGLEPGPVVSLLHSQDGLSDILADEEHAWRLGIQGVPSFVVNGRVVASGAQPAEELSTALLQQSSKAPESQGFCRLDGTC